jgi:hypothetical protein
LSRRAYCTRSGSPIGLEIPPRIFAEVALQPLLRKIPHIRLSVEDAHEAFDEWIADPTKTRY